MNPKSMIIFQLFIFLSIFFNGCTESKVTVDNTFDKDLPNLKNTKLIDVFKSYTLMKEQVIATNIDTTVLATYFNPVTRYTHGILGDAIEAGGVVVYTKGKYIEFKLSDEYVFEDIAPRLYDVDKDGKEELICIRAKIGAGAGIVIYKLKESEIEEYANVPEIGVPNRWLNIASISDLNNDGNTDIAWVQTPHIGGILKISEVKKGILKSIDDVTLFSNHAIGQTNLCLSVITSENGKLILHLPSHDRKQIVSLSFDSKWNEISRKQVDVDFSKTLLSQSDFKNILNTNYNCIQ